MRILILFWLFLFAPLSMATAGDVLSPPQAWAKAEAGEVLIVDVRTPPEYHWSGSPKGAARANWWQVGGRNGFLKDILDITEGDRTRPIALICARGVRSSEATAFLKAAGFTQVFDIGEGMLGSRAGPGWLARELPVN